jgi:hypothetical protein
MYVVIDVFEFIVDFVYVCERLIVYNEYIVYVPKIPQNLILY